MEIVSASLPEAHLAQLRAQAAEHDRTLAAEIRRAVRTYVEPASDAPTLKVPVAS